MLAVRSAILKVKIKELSSIAYSTFMNDCYMNENHIILGETDILERTVCVRYFVYIPFVNIFVVWNVSTLRANKT